MGSLPDPLDIPAFLKRDANNRAEFMSMSSEVEVEKESRPAKTMTKVKANGAAKPTGKPAVKAVPKAAKAAKTAPKASAKPAKGLEKAKAKPKTEIDQFGLRKGSAKSEAAAMYARKSGATLEEVKDKVGSIQLNVLKGLEAEGFVVEKEKETRDGQRAVTRYWLSAKK